MFPGLPDRARRSSGPLLHRIQGAPSPPSGGEPGGREGGPAVRPEQPGWAPARRSRCPVPRSGAGPRILPGREKRHEKRKAPRDPAGLSYQVPTVTRGAAHRWVPGRAGVRRAGWVPGEGSGWAVPLMSGPRAARRGFRPPHRGVHLVRIEAGCNGWIMTNNQGDEAIATRPVRPIPTLVRRCCRARSRALQKCYRLLRF